ncbi:MAG TPA: excinuclease ABC subunit C [Prolixibacteraceae bacterium]|nr:excinuclease ABC subunit C [Prolixibacteraceae bacterium]
MGYFAYVIYSADYKRFYKGHCKNLDVRLDQHNKGQTKSTKPFVPWELVYTEQFDSKEDAILREKYLKTAAGRRFLKNKIPYLF